MTKTFGSFIVDTSDIQKKFNTIKKTLHDPSGVFTRFLSDIKKAAPGIVADSVRTIYNIKRSEITPTKKKTELKKAGTIRMDGQELATLNLKYQGRVLTPLHFDMKKKEEKSKKSEKYKSGTQPEKRKKYKISLNVKKKRKTVSSPTADGKIPFLAPARKGNARIIPWFRYSDGKIEPMRTLSLPQMVDNKKVRKEIDQRLGKKMHERYDHHFDEALKKASN